MVQTRYGSCQEATAQGCWEATDTSRYYILIKSFRIEIMDCVQFPVFLTTRRLVAWTKATLALMRNWKLELIERTARCALTHWSRVPVESLPVYIYTHETRNPGTAVPSIWFEPLGHGWRSVHGTWNEPNWLQHVDPVIHDAFTGRARHSHDLIGGYSETRSVSAQSVRALWTLTS